jgi:hypothetical protein
MDTHSTTFWPKDWPAIEPQLLDLLLLIYDAAICRGVGVGVVPPENPYAHALLAEVTRRWDEQSAALHGWMRGADDPVLTADELPGWLREQQRQKETAS